MITHERLEEIVDFPREACLTRTEAAELVAYYRRYAWLREQEWFSGKLCVVANPKHAVKLGNDCPSLFRLDARVDAELAAK